MKKILNLIENRCEKIIAVKAAKTKYPRDNDTQNIANAIITDCEFVIDYLKSLILPEGYFKTIEAYLPNYYTSDRVALSNILSSYLEGCTLSCSDKEWVDKLEDPLFYSIELDYKLYCEALKEKGLREA